VTAAIAAALYPEADIRTEVLRGDQARTRCRRPCDRERPFGKLTLHDPDHNAGRHSIHNHFIMKGLDLTRPGGLIAVVTSRFTLDAKADAARQAMSERADLIGAIRLPAGTFRAAAGTDVVCDILVLSKRLPGAEVRGESWMSLAPVVTVDGEVLVNEYFATHPEMILGELRRVNGPIRGARHRRHCRPWQDHRGRDHHVVAGAVERGLTYQPGTAPELAIGQSLAAAPAALSGQPAAGPAAGPAAASTTEPAGQLVRAPDTERSTVRKEGSIVTSGVATFTQVRGGELEPFQAKPKSRAPELRALCRLRTPWPTCWRSNRAPPTTVRSVPPRCS